MRVNKDKKRSLGRRVIIYSLIMTILSILGIYQSSVAVQNIGTRFERYREYSKIQILNGKIDASYMELKKYTILFYLAQSQLEDNDEQKDLIHKQYTSVLERLNENKKELVALSEELVNMGDSKNDQELIEAMTSWLDSIQEFEDAMASVFSAVSGSTGNQVTQFIQSMSDCEKTIEEKETNYEEVLSVKMEYLKHKVDVKISGTNMFGYIFMANNLIVMVIIISALSIQLVKPSRASQKRCTEIVNKIQNGNGDLTERVPVRANDEVGALSKGINEILGELHNTIKMLANHASILNRVSENVANELKKSDKGNIALQVALRNNKPLYYSILITTIGFILGYFYPPAITLCCLISIPTLWIFSKRQIK